MENIYMIGICIAAILILFFNRFLKFTFKILLRTSFGLVVIYLVNTMITAKKFYIGINFLSGITSAILGLPGIISLYIAKGIL